MSNYVDGERLKDELKEYYNDYHKRYKIEGGEIPRLPEYVGECILLIAYNLAKKPCFSGYSYKDEMIEDGIENCIMYAYNIDPDKNPFSYITQIINNAFIRRIDKEKKQLYVKYKSYDLINIQNSVEGKDNSLEELNDISQAYMKEYEYKLEQKRKKATQNKSANSVTKIMRK
jgi:hypothetical protein